MAAERINDWDQLYPGRFLKAGDIREGEKRLLTISAVELDELETDNGKREKGVLSFAGEKQQMPLNKTNGICLREMFGRVPYKWVGRRFAIYQDLWGNEPCIRIWGSPELEADLVVEIKLPKRRPFTMTMHAMGDERSLRNAGRKAAGKLEPVRKSQPPPAQEPLRDRAQELLDMMARAGNLDELSEVCDIIRTEDDDFNAREHRLLAKATERRRVQLAEEGPDDDDRGQSDPNAIIT